MPQHSLTSADPQVARRGVVAVIVREGRLLAIRRSQQVLAPGMFCFPGGGIEGDESEELALVRELQEELNVKVRPVVRLWECVTSWRVSLAWWMAEMISEEPPQPNLAEVESIHWHTPEEMLALPNLLESNAEFLQRILSGDIQLKAKS